MEWNYQKDRKGYIIYYGGHDGQKKAGTRFE
jgi:hypothetical protein